MEFTSTLLIRVSQKLHSVTDEEIYQIYKDFSSYGPVEGIVICEDSIGFQALIYYPDNCNAISVKFWLQGRKIWDDYCQLDIQYSNPDGTPIFCNNKIGEAEAKIESDKVQIEANSEEDAPDLESDSRAFMEAKYGAKAMGTVNEVDNKVTENLRHSLVFQELDSHMEIFLNKSLSQAFSVFSLPNLPSLDGCIRDVDEIDACDIRVRALGSIPLKSSQKAVGDEHVLVRVAGTLIHNCKWLYADSDGILISLGNNLKSSGLLHNGCQGYIMPYVYGYFPNSKIVNLSVSCPFYHIYEKGKKEAVQLESNDVVILTSMLVGCSQLELLKIRKHFQIYAMTRDILITNSLDTSVLFGVCYNCTQVGRDDQIVFSQEIEFWSFICNVIQVAIISKLCGSYRDEANLINVCKVAGVATRSESQFKLEKVILWVTKLVVHLFAVSMQIFECNGRVELYCHYFHTTFHLEDKVIFQGGGSDTSIGDLACGLGKTDLKKLGMWPKNVGREEGLAIQPRLGTIRPRHAKRALSWHADYVMHSIIIISCFLFTT
ncbi:hypothetical protein PTKIN_Ptkin03bG0118100 [Pterospermum kingtungense]